MNLELLLPVWTPHAGQREFLENPSKIKVLSCGRRWGKTDACAASVVMALHRPTPTRHIILAPTLDQATLLFDRVIQMLSAIHQDDEFKPRRSPYPKLSLGPHTLIARSGHLGRSLRGNEATDIIIDEAAYVPEDLITEIAMPMLSTTDGSLTLISTPKGKNHFWRFFEMGQNGEHGIWSRAAPSSESPFVSQAFLDVQRDLISERAFDIEYEAAFRDSSGRVFSTESINQCLVQKITRKIGYPFCIGVDWAKFSDYSAVVVLAGNTSDAELVEVDRFNKMNWSEQTDRVASLIRKYPFARVCCDSTGAQDAIIEMLVLKLEGCASVKEFTFSSASKRQIINNLVGLFERGAIKMEPDPQLLRELEHFEIKLTSSGNEKMEAVGNYNDDMVVALALASHELPKRYQPAIRVGKVRTFSKSAGQVSSMRA